MQLASSYRMFWVILHCILCQVTTQYEWSYKSRNLPLKNNLCFPAFFYMFYCYYPKLGQSIRIIQVVCLMQWSSHRMANGYHSRINENNPRLRSNALESRKRMDRKDIGQGQPTNVHTLIFQHTADVFSRVDKFESTGFNFSNNTRQMFFFACW